MRACCILAAWLLATPLSAEDRAVERSLAAQQDLEQAALILRDARGSLDRVTDLAAAIRAYEDGLIDLREAIQQTRTQAEQIRADFVQKRETHAKLLSILQSIGRDGLPGVLLHPAGPTSTSRSAMMIDEVSTQIEIEIEQIKQQLSELVEIDAVQADTPNRLAAALEELQDAKAELNKAIANRIALPIGFAEDPVRTRDMVRSSATLRDFLEQLSQIDIGSTADPADFAAGEGQMQSPVAGRMYLSLNVPDRTGLSRPGVRVATFPQAVVTIPTDATVRFAGPLLDYGPMVILELAPDYMLILAGMDQLTAKAGQVLVSGTPIGIMGGTILTADSFLSRNSDNKSGKREETLYIELRNGETVLDPEVWFALEKE